MTPLQAAALRIVADNHGVITNAVGFRLRRLGLIAKRPLGCGNLVLPASSVLNSLERRKLVVSFNSGRDQWTVKCWAVTTAGKQLIAQEDAAP